MKQHLWIVSTLEPHTMYANNRLKETLQKRGLTFSFIKPAQLFPSANQGELKVGTSIRQLPSHILVRAGTSSITTNALAALRQAELQRVKTMNSSAAYLNAGSKISTYLNLQQTAIVQPKTILISKQGDSSAEADFLIHELNLPLIIKASTGARGETVSKCETKDEVIESLTIIRHSQNEWIAQAYVSSSVGRDIRVYVIGKKPIRAIVREAQSGFIANISQGGTATAFPLSPVLTRQAEYIAEHLDLDMAGLDFFFSDKKDEYIFNEVNLAGQFTGMEKAHSIDIADRIIEYLLK